MRCDVCVLEECATSALGAPGAEVPQQLSDKFIMCWLLLLIRVTGEGSFLCCGL